MTDASFRRFGAWCAVALALATLSYAVLLVLAEGGPSLAERLLQADAVRALNRTTSLLLALAGLLTTAGVAAVHARLAGSGRSWAHWAAGLGLIGGAMMAAHGYWDFVRVPVLLAQWTTGDPGRMAAIATFAGVPNPVDPRGLGTLLFVGLFALVAGRLILADGGLSARVGWLGLVYGGLLVLAFVAGMAGPSLVRTALTGLALGAAGPLWWLLVGWELMHVADAPAGT